MSLVNPGFPGSKVYCMSSCCIIKESKDFCDSSIKIKEAEYRGRKKNKSDIVNGAEWPHSFQVQNEVDYIPSNFQIWATLLECWNVEQRVW